MTCQLASAIANWKTDFARSTPTMGSAAVAFISDSPRLSADTPHHMRPAGTMMPRSRGESIPSFERALNGCWEARTAGKASGAALAVCFQRLDRTATVGQLRTVGASPKFALEGTLGWNGFAGLTAARRTSRALV